MPNREPNLIVEKECCTRHITVTETVFLELWKRKLARSSATKKCYRISDIIEELIWGDDTL